VKFILPLLTLLLVSCRDRPPQDASTIAGAFASREKNVIFVAVTVLNRHSDPGKAHIDFDAPYELSRLWIESYAAELDSYTDAFQSQVNVEYRADIKRFTPRWPSAFWE